MTDFLNGKVTLHGGDCREVIKTLAGASVDSVVTDPPYALVSISKRFGANGAAPAKGGVYERSARGFMGKKWDNGEAAFAVEFWAEVMRVLKPGGHVVAFSGTRTYHRLACAIEDAGFEIRDQLAWAYGSGFPKSHDVSKAIDKAAGHWRGRAGEVVIESQVAKGKEYERTDKGEPITDAAREWQGWGTALKPAWESICFARKPMEFWREYAIIGSLISDLERRLWAILPANIVAQVSASSPHAPHVERSASVQWNAEELASIQADLSGAMDMSLFESAMISSLNTVLSWSATWTDASQPENTFTTETELSTIIGLRTLRFSLLKITPESIILAHRTGRWLTANASPAESIFNASVLRLSGTLELSALANVIAKEADSSLDAGARPAWEPIVLARKPLIGTVAENVLAHGTGALNIDGCRVESDGVDLGRNNNARTVGTSYVVQREARRIDNSGDKGRWPANIVHDGSDEVVAAFPDRDTTRSTVTSKPGSVYGNGAGLPSHTGIYGADESGSAARFFYTAKADAEDRTGSKHPTVKPVDLMQWLVRLVTPKGGLVLDPFAGSGTTGEAAWREGMRCTLIEREEEYQTDIARRLEMADAGPDARLHSRLKAAGKIDEPESLPLFGGAT